jgi:hypothetical protein
MPIVSTDVASQARAERVDLSPMAHLLERLQSSFSPQILASAVLTARVTRNGYPAGQA